MRKILYALLIFGSLGHAEPGWQILGYWTLAGVYTRETSIFSQATNVDLLGTLSLTRNLDDEFAVAFRPAFRFINGREQDVFADRLPKDKLYAEEAKASWTPGTRLDFEAGALNQVHLHNSLLVYHRPFPAVTASWNFSDERMPQKHSATWQVTAQLAVPSSYTLDTQATGNESLPWLQTYSLHGNTVLMRRLGTELHLNYFRFDNLPQIVAVSSARLGNSADVLSSVTGRFRQGFEGLAPALDLAYPLDGWTLRWWLQGIWNWRASRAMGIGESSRLSVSHDLGNQRSVGAGLVYYKVLPDVSPAVYTDPIFSNNRVGVGGELHLDHERWQVRFKLSYYRDMPYYRNDSMGQRDMALIAIESLRGEELLAF